VNNNAENQPNEALRKLNSGPVLPEPFPQVFCTKWGTTRRGEMYIIGAHMDGIGYGEAANDDGSGTALVMELARVFSMPDVTTDVTIRFALWNGEEGGLRGANAYVNQRKDLQGQPNEPKWLGMIQHDMMMWDHGMPRADGTLNPEQRPEADFNIEFQSVSDRADTCTPKAEIPTCSKDLAFVVKAAADKYSKNYPGTVGPHMTNTDSGPFMNIVPAISLRENERGMHTGAGWNPHWHQPTDLFSTFSDKDFTLGLNAAQATLSAIAGLSKAKVK
jgi:Zn-dependent M28 family amino/carboxypeptidase